MKTGDMLRAAAGAAGGSDAGIGAPQARWSFDQVDRLWKDVALTSPILADGDIILGVTGRGTGGHKLSIAANGPTYKTGIQNGLSVARFDGTNDILTAATGGGGHAQPVSFLAVLRMNAVDQGTKYAIAEANNTFVPVAIRNSGPNYLTTDLHVVTDIIADTNFHVFFVTLNGASTEFFVDNQQGTVFAPANTGDFGDVSLGGLPAGAGFCNVDIGEVAVYHELLNFETASTYTYALAAKWGITI